jgi:quercetin dioxygenase-like cupin family protein
MDDNKGNTGREERVESAGTKQKQAQEGPEGIFRTTLAYNEKAMMCHFTMKKGAKIPLHHHPAVQNGYIISGKVRFNRGMGYTFIAEAGDSYVFDPEEPHGAEVLEDAELVECFAPMRPEYI